MTERKFRIQVNEEVCFVLIDRLPTIHPGTRVHAIDLMAVTNIWKDLLGVVSPEICPVLVTIWIAIGYGMVSCKVSTEARVLEST